MTSKVIKFIIQFAIFIPIWVGFVIGFVTLLNFLALLTGWGGGIGGACGHIPLLPIPCEAGLMMHHETCRSVCLPIQQALIQNAPSALIFFIFLLSPLAPFTVYKRKVFNRIIISRLGMIIIAFYINAAALFINLKFTNSCLQLPDINRFSCHNYWGFFAIFEILSLIIINSILFGYIKILQDKKT